MLLDLAGHRSGLLAVLCLAPEGRHGKPPRNCLWVCACDCGGPMRAIPASRLMTTHVKSCGCTARQTLDLKDRRFGMLVAVELLPSDPRVQGRQWSCQCDCGRTKSVRVKDLRSGNTTSCGCRINRLLVSRGEITPRQRLILEAMGELGGRRMMDGLQHVTGTSSVQVSLNTTRLAERGYLTKHFIVTPGVRGRQVELRLLPKGREYLLAAAAQ